MLEVKEKIEGEIAISISIKIVVAALASLAAPSGDPRWSLVPDGEGRLYLTDLNPIEQEPEAAWNVETDTFFVLFTRRNPTAGQRITNTAASINASQWNNNAPGTRFIIHGWTQSSTSGMNADIRSAFLASADHNVVGSYYRNSI